MVHDISKTEASQNWPVYEHTVEEGIATKTCSSRVDSNPLTCISLPSYMADTIWKCANDLVQEDSAIIEAPGDHTAFMVKSISGQRPHYVKTPKKGGFACDDHCIGFNCPECAPTQLLLH